MENKSIAIFIDAENIPAKYAKSIFDIASDYGEEAWRGSEGVGW